MALKKFNNWLGEMDMQAPPPNGGVKPEVSPEISEQISQLADQVEKLSVKMKEVISKLGINKPNSEGENQDKEEKPLGTLGMETGTPTNNANLRMNSGPQGPHI